MKLMLCKGWLAVVLLLVSACAQVGAAQQAAQEQLERPERVLFVGNSFTFYNNGLHKHYGNLLRAAALSQSGKTRNRMLTYSGAGLREHTAALESALSREPWDVAIMHDHSSGPLTNWQRFVESATALAKISTRNGVSPVLLMTWAYKGDSEMGIEIAEAYTRAGEELSLQVIPVGLAFLAAQQASSINLYTPDLLRYEEGKAVYKKTVKHPSLAGTYLAACTVFAALTKRSPEGLAYTAGLNATEARFLQRVAWNTVQDYSLANH